MNKLKKLFLLSLLMLTAISSYSQYYSRVHEEYKMNGQDCRMLVYSVYLNNYNYDPTDDKTIGTYSVVFGNSCIDFSKIPEALDFIKSKNTNHLTVVTSQIELSPTPETSNSDGKRINSSCFIITTDFLDNNGSFENLKDDIRLGNHIVTKWTIDGEFVGDSKIVDLLRSKGYNIEYSINGAYSGFEIKKDDPEYTKKLNEYLRRVSQ